ncbi:N-acetylmuramoyl-L-alanine amidase family protein [Galbibacter sp.]|uniref:N-acetylmuramoyl-L-alanine amidase family protein n=1 Tax=Galbibacter sp. TaxID=2918471 RepID=UPI003A92BE28
MKKAVKNVSFIFLLLKMCFIFSQEGSIQKRIVLDPGHGGKDFGAIAINGLKEKDLVLDVALEIIKLNAQSETPLDIYLTRYNDTLISLSDRTKLARALKADLFISLHCNDALNSNARGIEVYTSRSVFGFSDSSVWFAYRLQKNIKRQLGFESRGVKFADFQVIREVNGLCPVVLLELGFLSNADERSYLVEKQHMERIASVLLSSIINH